MSPEVTLEFAISTLFLHVSNWNTEPSMSPPETSRTKSDRNCSPFWYMRLTIRSSFGFICLLPHSVSVFPVSCETPYCKSRRQGQPIPQWRCRWALRSGILGGRFLLCFCRCGNRSFGRVRRRLPLSRPRFLLSLGNRLSGFRAQHTLFLFLG